MWGADISAPRLNTPYTRHYTKISLSLLILNLPGRYYLFLLLQMRKWRIRQVYPYVKADSKSAAGRQLICRFYFKAATSCNFHHSVIRAQRIKRPWFSTRTSYNLHVEFRIPLIKTNCTLFSIIVSCPKLLSQACLLMIVYSFTFQHLV